MKYLKQLGLIASAVSLTFFIACSGGKDEPDTPKVSISISPSETVQIGESKTIQVTAQNTDFTVSSVTPAIGLECVKNGSAVTVTPSKKGDYAIMLTATADASKRAYARITVPQPLTPGSGYGAVKSYIGNSETYCFDYAAFPCVGSPKMVVFVIDFKDDTFEPGELEAVDMRSKK